MKLKFLETRIPTLLGMFIITVGLVLATLFTNNQTNLQSGAQVVKQPQDVRITNVTDKSFTVSYRTESPISGTLNYGTDNSLGLTAFDEKDASGNIGNRIIHSITIQNLQPSTKYYFSILSGGETYLNNDQNFEVTTAPSLSSQTSNTDIKGKIIDPDSTVPNEAIVYATADNAQVVSSLVKSDGTYDLVLNNLLSSDLSKPFVFQANTVIRMLVLGQSSTSSALIYYSQVNDVPVITLSNNYDFRSEQAPAATSSAQPESFPSLESTPSSKLYTPKILTPQQNQGFSNQAPLFKGTALPEQSVQITIHSAQVLEATVSADAYGNWSYSPSANLSPGTHTITIVTKDAYGILRTLTQSFVVYAQTGTTISQTPTPTPTPLPTFTPTPTAYNLTQASPSASPQNPLPATGNAFIITAGIVGFIISLIGGLLFLLSKGA